MEKPDIMKLVQSTRTDGERLINAADTIYSISMVVIGSIGLIGVISGLITLTAKGFGLAMGLAILFSTAIFCFLSYLFVVMSTHVAKVLVHSSFSTAALLENAAGIEYIPTVNVRKDRSEEDYRKI